MELAAEKRRRVLLIGGGVAVAALIAVFWQAVQALVTLLALSLVLMAAALPLCRLLEKRLSPALSAAAAFTGLSLGALAVLGLIVPALVRQLQQLAGVLPQLLDRAGERMAQVEQLFAERGVRFSLTGSALPEALGQQVQQALPRFLAGLQGAAAGASQLMLAPLLAFYLLRDRRRIAGRLMLLIPIRRRRAIVQAFREMRRETAGFLRGQLLICLCVGGLTALGLLLVGTPGWLLMGLLMGVMELIPYVGPLLAGIPAVLLGLSGGLPKALWTLGVLVAVQQAEGSFLSPNLLSGATKLSPLTVLLAISAGGLIGGTVGMLAALPLVVSLRGAVRVLRSPAQAPE